MPDMPPAVVVTGASAGLGRAIARRFARNGWRVGLIARGLDGLEGAAADVRALGGEPLVLQADVSDAEAVFAAADRARATFGAIDVWVNNAMATVVGPVETVTPAEFRRVHEVTYLGQVHGTMAALRHMRPVNRGTIVSIGSALAYRSIPLQVPYCAAKAATRAFVEGVRSELSHGGSAVRVSMVHMPAMNTPQFEWARTHMDAAPRPVAPVFRPEDAADAVYDAARSGPREIWVGGSTAQAIVGEMVMPGLLDRYLGSVAWDGQIDSRRQADRRDNLFEPVPGDHGADGPFGDEVKPAPWRFDAAMVRIAGAVGAAVIAGGLVGALTSAVRSGRRR